MSLNSSDGKQHIHKYSLTFAECLQRPNRQQEMNFSSGDSNVNDPAHPSSHEMRIQSARPPKISSFIQEQKDHQKKICHDLLNLFEFEGNCFLNHIITGDKRNHHHELDSK